AHVVMADDCYFSYRTVARELAARWGVALDVVDLTSLGAVRAALRPETAMVWAETPSNPRLKVVDLAAIAEVAHAAGARLVVDSTFATPVLTRPIEHGADVVLHSATKYLGGHSDAQLGALIFACADAVPAEAVAQRDRGAEDDLVARLRRSRTLLGPAAAPMSSWLVLRGLRTLACRVRWQASSALHIAQVLRETAAVAAVHYPGLPDHPQNEVARRQMTGGFGG